jgi:hypothetical protein
MESIAFDGKQTTRVFDAAVALGLPVRCNNTVRTL